MSAPQNFRSAFNGFNREDVVRYLEYLNNKHTAQVNQLTGEADFLRSRLEALEVSAAQSEAVAALEAERDALLAKVEELQARLDAQEQPTGEEAPREAYTESQELEVYRRAERTERMARERAELIYHQATNVLSEASLRLDTLTRELLPMADSALSQLQSLQQSVSAGRQALADAASVLQEIRPNT